MKSPRTTPLPPQRFGTGQPGLDTPARSPSPAPAKKPSLTGTPTVNPLNRDEVAPAGSYQPHTAVWTYRHGSGNPGTVRAATDAAVLVDYHIPGQRGILTDTVSDLYVMAREQPDPLLDKNGRSS